MEQETVLQGVLDALQEHFKKIDNRFTEMENKMNARFTEVDKRFSKMETRFDKVDKQLENLNKKFDGQRIELQETQETTDFVASKVVQHEKKLRHINAQ